MVRVTGSGKAGVTPVACSSTVAAYFPAGINQTRLVKLARRFEDSAIINDVSRCVYLSSSYCTGNLVDMKFYQRDKFSTLIWSLRGGLLVRRWYGGAGTLSLRTS
jgi:hypothetical protein